MDSPGLRDRRWVPWQLTLILLPILLVTACAGTGGGSPTAPAIPSFPAVTPISARPEVSATPTPSSTVPPTVEPSPTSGSDPTVHTVAPGDTLLGLAKLYGIPMAAIQIENDMGSSTVVQAGQTLTIPSEDEWEGASPFWVAHEIQPGETLIGIARRYDVDVERLKAANELDNADQITVGDLLVVPLNGPALPPVPSATDVPAPTSAPEPTDTPEPSVTVASMSSAPTGADPAPPIGDALPPPDLASWPQTIARLINEVRADHGLPPYAYNETLEQAAQAHANDCSQRGWGSHTGSDGSNIKLRVARAGYDGTGWAECWAQTQTPQKAVEVWMDETPPNDPHRRTLLSDWFTEIGLGVSDAEWGTYVIANFGRP